MANPDHPQHLPPVRRTGGGHRRYDAAAVDRLAQGYASGTPTRPSTPAAEPAAQ